VTGGSVSAGTGDPGEGLLVGIKGQKDSIVDKLQDVCSQTRKLTMPGPDFVVANA